MSGQRKEFGKHYLVEFTGCDPEKIKFVPLVRDMLLAAAQASHATILESYFHQFTPWGVTGMIFIAESHFSIHTWPEDRYAAFDVLTCGEMLPEQGIEVLRVALGAENVDVRVLTRGFIAEGGRA